MTEENTSSQNYIPDADDPFTTDPRMGRLVVKLEQLKGRRKIIEDAILAGNDGRDHSCPSRNIDEDMDDVVEWPASNLRQPTVEEVQKMYAAVEKGTMKAYLLEGMHKAITSNFEPASEIEDVQTDQEISRINAGCAAKRKRAEYEEDMDYAMDTSGPSCSQANGTMNGAASMAGDGDDDYLNGTKRARTKEWDKVMKHFNTMDKFQPVPHGPSKSHLEDLLNDAIRRGDYNAAEEINARLMDREFGGRLDHAFNANAFEEHRMKEAKKKLQKRKWMFDGKARWESKANM